MPSRTDILKRSFIDAEALEMIRSYHLETDETYEFVERQDDYYITLINVMCDLLEQLYADNPKEKKELIEAWLLDVAKGLLVYSDANTSEKFQYVNQAENALYVAAIYYVCQYEAIASLILKKVPLRLFRDSVSARKIYYIICSLQTDNLHPMFHDEIAFLDEFIIDGNLGYIEDEIKRIKELTERDSFPSVEEFFNAQILLTVLKKFVQHNIWRTLRQYGQTTDWHEYVNYSRKQGILSFLPSQEGALSNGLLTFDRSFSLGMATSAGKTYITELVIYQEHKKNNNKKMLYLAPLRSLSREITERYRAIGKEFNFEVRCSYGGHISEMEDASLDDAKLLISTPEAFVATGIEASEFSLVICDEGQLIDDYSRGIEYELLLTRLRQQENVRFLFLSAIIPNLRNVNEWLGGKENEIGDSPYRPCRQRLCVARWNEVEGRYYVDVFGADYKEVLYSKQIGGVYKKEPKNKELCVPASLIALQAGPVMVFSSIKAWCDGLVDEMNTYLSRTQQKIREPNERIERIIEYCSYLLGEEQRLVKSLKLGFAYHHADLPQDIRENIEILLNNGDIKLVYCTTTLAEGVNLPIKTIILCYLNNPINPSIYIGEEKVKNIIGRVGRAGRTTYGNIVLFGTKAKWLVERALTGEIKREIKGTLYDYVHYLQMQGKNVENWLDLEELSSSIDSTITKSAADNGLDAIDINSLVINSFAYTFSTPEEKENLMNMFVIRYQEMKKYFEQNSYEIYKESGLTIGEIERLKQFITPELREVLKSKELTTLVKELIKLVRKVKLADYDETKKTTILTIENVTEVAVRWVSERKYNTISMQTGLPIDDVLQIVMKITKSYAYKAKSIVTYLQRTVEIDNGMLDMVPEYLQQGVPNSFMLYLIEKRLSNRVGLYVIDDVVKAHGWGDFADDTKLLNLKTNKIEISKEIDQSETPAFVKIKLQRWLNQA